MPNPFIEERLTLDVRMGASYGDAYNVEIVQTSGGNEYPRLVHPYPTRYFNIAFVMDTAELNSKVLDLYDRCFGQYAGFRVRAIDDYSTNGKTGTPTPIDQTLALVSAGVYQLQKYYGASTPVLSIGRPVRTLFKPVANTARLAIASIEILNGVAHTITAISKAASAVVTVGTHTFVVNDSVYFTGALGMTAINGLWGSVTAISGTTITVNINSIGFSTYTSAGTVSMRRWVTDTTTGKITFAANKTGTITAITQAASAVVTIGAHTFVVGGTVHFTGVLGMTQINGLRGTITAIGATTITVNINSSAFTAYTSAGTVNSRPQTGESVTGGCEFDIPCRFNSRVHIEQTDRGIRSAQDIELKEMIAL